MMAERLVLFATPRAIYWPASVAVAVAVGFAGTYSSPPGSQLLQPVMWGFYAVAIFFACDAAQLLLFGARWRHEALVDSDSLHAALKEAEGTTPPTGWGERAVLYAARCSGEKFGSLDLRCSALSVDLCYRDLAAHLRHRFRLYGIVAYTTVFAGLLAFFVTARNTALSEATAGDQAPLFAGLIVGSFVFTGTQVLWWHAHSALRVWRASAQEFLGRYGNAPELSVPVRVRTPVHGVPRPEVATIDRSIKTQGRDPLAGFDADPLAEPPVGANVRGNDRPPHGGTSNDEFHL